MEEIDIPLLNGKSLNNISLDEFEVGKLCSLILAI